MYGSIRHRARIRTSGISSLAHGRQRLDAPQTQPAWSPVLRGSGLTWRSSSSMVAMAPTLLDFTSGSRAVGPYISMSDTEQHGIRMAICGRIPRMLYVSIFRYQRGRHVNPQLLLPLWSTDGLGTAGIGLSVVVDSPGVVQGIVVGQNRPQPVLARGQVAVVGAQIPRCGQRGV